MSDLTELLTAIDRGDPKAAEELLPLVYGDLRKLAAGKMARETPGQTLQPTALVDEAWLRVTGGKQATFEGRTHFFGAAAEAMRRILIERARRRQARRHGGGMERAEFEEAEIASPGDDEQLLAVNEALEKLALERKVEADLVKLRYFVGMSNEEAASALGISPRTAQYYWTHARAWLFREINTTK